MRKKILIGALAVLALVPVLLLPVSAADLLIDIVPEDINVTDTEYVDVQESRFMLLAVFVQTDALDNERPLFLLDGIVGSTSMYVNQQRAAERATTLSEDTGVRFAFSHFMTPNLYDWALLAWEGGNDGYSNQFAFTLKRSSRIDARNESDFFAPGIGGAGLLTAPTFRMRYAYDELVAATPPDTGVINISTLNIDTLDYYVLYFLTDEPDEVIYRLQFKSLLFWFNGYDYNGYIGTSKVYRYVKFDANAAYNAGYRDGNNVGYTDGYNTGWADAWRSIDANGAEGFSVPRLITGLFAAPAEFITGMLDFEVFGINLATAVKVIFTILLVVAIILLIVKFIPL